MKKVADLAIRVDTLFHGRVTMDFGRLARRGREALARQVFESVRSIGVSGSKETLPKIYRSAHTFAEYLDALEIEGIIVNNLSDVSPEVLWGFSRWMDLRKPNWGVVTQFTVYYGIVALLANRAERAPECVHPMIRAGEFPETPYPGLADERHHRAPYPRDVTVKVLRAAATETAQILSCEWKGPDSDAVAVVVLAIAFGTAFNTSTALRLEREAVLKSPSSKDVDLLRAFKGRGNRIIEKPILSKEPGSPGLPSPTALHRFLVTHAQSLDPRASMRDKGSLLLYRTFDRYGKPTGRVHRMNRDRLGYCLLNFAERNDIRGDDGRLIRLNLSRVRVTAAMIAYYEVLGRSITATRDFLGQKSVNTTSEFYLSDTEEALDGHAQVVCDYQSWLRGRG